MDKNYNLIVELKRHFFNSVRGLKQGDNNSVLNITLIQNSIPIDLTGCTVRINYKLINGQTLLQMADIVEAKKGKIRINILTKALVYAGEIKADISVFSSNNRKITSTTISLFVDASVYVNDYLENEDLDIIQDLFTTEEKRIRAENIRKENEIARISKEDIRKTDETTRCASEKDRISKENIRCSNEKNRIENSKVQKKEIEDITALNGTMKNEHTSRTTEYNDLKKIILDENSSATLKNEINSINKQIDENNILNKKTDDKIISLENSVDGFADFNLEGRTLNNLALETAVGNKKSTREDSLSYVINETNRNKFKLDTTYTLLLNCNIKVNGEKIILQIKKIKKDGSYVFHWFNTTGSVGNFNYVGTFNLDSTVYDHVERLGLYSASGDNEVDITKFMILEGDWTDKTIPGQFDGMKSVGETEGNKIEVLSRGKNLFDINKYPLSPGWISRSKGGWNGAQGYYATQDFIPIVPNTKYNLQINVPDGSNPGYALYNKSKIFINGGKYGIFTSPSNAHYIRFTVNPSNKNNAMLLLNNGNVVGYEPYKGDTLDIQLKEPLRSLSDDVKDIAHKNIIERNVAKIVFDGTESWKNKGINNGYIGFQCVIPKIHGLWGKKIEKSNVLFCDTDKAFYKTDEAFTIFKDGSIYISLLKSKLSSLDITGLKKYLKTNPITVLYQLAEPTIEQLDKPLNIETFKDGSLVIDSVIPSTINLNYPGNLKGQIETNTNKIGEIDNNFYSVFENILMVADKELRMSSVELLKTDTIVDIKNKVNEIINIWKEDDRNDDMG